MSILMILVILMLSDDDSPFANLTTSANEPVADEDTRSDDCDWADSLDGVRLEWDEESTPADDSETLV